jgi:N6-adenosine-specific RNA methylase IME4
MNIDKEFKSLIPELSDSEKEQLEENIKRDGCREPLTLWNDILIDGHNRFEICEKHGIKFSTVAKELKDRDEAKIWIIDNQKGRRNLSDGWKYELAQTKKALLSEKGKEKQKETIGGFKHKLSVSTTNVETDKHDTRKEIAKELEWSQGKVSQADYVWKKAEPEVREKIKKDKVSIHEAYKDIKKQEKIEAINKQKEAIKTGQVKLPEGVYEVVSIDPPWNYNREYDPEGSRVASPYPEMNQEQLLKLNPPFAKDCVLFLWTTHKFLFDAKELMDKWNFDYKATLVWNKEKMGIGKWFRMQCEFCLVGIKGNPIWQNTEYRDIISESRREHSRKPEAFYKMVEAITCGRKLDYFSREQREGWDSYGNDTEKF